MTDVKEIKERSVIIPKEVMSWLKSYRKKHTSDRAFARALGIHYNSVPRILAMGSCASETLKKIEFVKNAA